MISFTRSFVLLSMLCIISTCAAFKMVSVDEVGGSRVIFGSPEKEHVNAAILTAARKTGWTAKNVEDNTIQASMIFWKDHVIVVEIEYTRDFYRTYYKSSYGLKMFCSEGDMQSKQNMRESGQESCPGNHAPLYIEKIYRQWMQLLNLEIQRSLASI